jgi:hypothetical protein
MTCREARARRGGISGLTGLGALLLWLWLLRRLEASAATYWALARQRSPFLSARPTRRPSRSASPQRDGSTTSRCGSPGATAREPGTKTAGQRACLQPARSRTSRSAPSMSPVLAVRAGGKWFGLTARGHRSPRCRFRVSNTLADGRAAWMRTTTRRIARELPHARSRRHLRKRQQPTTVHVRHRGCDQTPMRSVSVLRQRPRSTRAIMTIAGQEVPDLQLVYSVSGIRESNPSLELGKLAFYR